MNTKPSSPSSARLITAVTFDAVDGERVSLVIGKLNDGITLWIGSGQTAGVEAVIDSTTALKIIDGLSRGIGKTDD